jgi:hypothetical protein
MRTPHHHPEAPTVAIDRIIRFHSPDLTCTWSGNSERALYNETNPAFPAGDTPHLSSGTNRINLAATTIFRSGLTRPGILDVHKHLRARQPSIDRNREFLYNEFVQAGGASE